MKTTCPIGRQEFLEKAQPLKIHVAGLELAADPREFATGSFGWYLNQKVPVTIEGKVVQVQVGMNLTVVGSKDMPKT